MMFDYPWLIICFLIFVSVALVLDLFSHRHSSQINLKQSIYWSLFWVTLSLFFNALIYLVMGKEAALNFFTGYLIEKSLSIDNLFVFLLIFNTFKVPRHLLHKALFWGILGALVLRALFIFGGLALLNSFHQVIYLFGALLIFGGIKLALEKDKEIKLEQNLALRLLKMMMPVTDNYESDRFFIRRGVQLFATPLFAVLLVIETSDLIFALDSIPAILAITTDPFIVYSSNIFAILGLRALFFVLEGAMGYFHYLHYGLSFILVFIGMKMLVQDLYPISTLISLGIVVMAVGVSVIMSVLVKKWKD